MKVLWLCPPSKFEGEIPLVGNNRWFKYLPFRCNFIYPIIAAEGLTLIKNAGHEIDFLDAPAEQKTMSNVLQQIYEKDYDLVIMEGRTAIITWLLEVAIKIKTANHRTKVALYGDHCIIRPHESLQSGIDYIVDCGDYDYGVYKLVEELSNRGYANPIFSESLVKNLDDLPFADRDLVPWQNYFESWRHRDKFGWYQSGRGCWAKCTFCVSGDAEISLSKNESISARELFEKSDATHVLGHNDKTGVIEKTPLLAALKVHKKEKIKVTTEDGRELVLSKDHRIFTNRGYVEAKHIKVGDDIYEL